MSDTFEGAIYRTATNWFPIIPKKDFEKKQINYLEIGAFYGANIISVARTYGAHPESKLYCIDPWIDYKDYPEYKTKQGNIYNTFLRNIENCGQKDKIIISGTPKVGEKYNVIINSFTVSVTAATTLQIGRASCRERVSNFV
jgi:hypothetical protein